MWTPVFTGSGLNDLTISGTVTAKKAHTFRVVIDDDASNPETFEWFLDDVSQASGVNCSTSPVSLTHGLSVTFGAVVGHTQDEYWEFASYPLYPRTIAPMYPYDRMPIKNVIKTPVASGRDLAINQWANNGTRWKYSFAYKIAGSNADTIINFWNQQNGEFGKFQFVDFVSRVYEGVQFGEYDGSTLADGSRVTFDLPFDGISSYTVYDDGVAQVEGGGNDYTVGDGTGVNGCDQIIFNSAPAADSILTIDVTGYRWNVASFAKQTMAKVRGFSYDTLPVSIISDLAYDGIE